LRDLKVKTSVAEDPLFSATEVRVRYSLIDIIGGNINVSQVQVVSPRLLIIQNEDGSSNLDPLLQSTQSKAPSEPGKPSKAPQINFQNVVLTNVTVRHIKYGKEGATDVSELSNVNIKLANIRNSRTATIGLTANARL